jgi:hypothetical protein
VPVELKRRILRTVLEEIVIDRVEEPAQEMGVVAILSGKERASIGVS